MIHKKQSGRRELSPQTWGREWAWDDRVVFLFCRRLQFIQRGTQNPFGVFCEFSANQIDASTCLALVPFCNQEANVWLGNIVIEVAASRFAQGVDLSAEEFFRLLEISSSNPVGWQTGLLLVHAG